MVVSDVKDQFIKKLDASEWMSEDVRQLAIDKGMVSAVIGIPQHCPLADLAASSAQYCSEDWLSDEIT